MTLYLSARQILFIHARLIDATGGEHGVRDPGRLEATAARPQATFGGEDLYANLFQKAAALMESLAQNRPFDARYVQPWTAETRLLSRIGGSGNLLDLTRHEDDRYCQTPSLLPGDRRHGCCPTGDEPER